MIDDLKHRCAFVSFVAYALSQNSSVTVAQPNDAIKQARFSLSSTIEKNNDPYRLVTCYISHNF